MRRRVEWSLNEVAADPFHQCGSYEIHFCAWINEHPHIYSSDVDHKFSHRLAIRETAIWA
jgi:hypothetical protein